MSDKADHALLFLLAGGQLSLSEWNAMDDDIRGAFVAAGRSLAVAKIRACTEATNGADPADVFLSELNPEPEAEDIVAAFTVATADRLRARSGVNAVR